MEFKLLPAQALMVLFATAAADPVNGGIRAKQDNPVGFANSTKTQRPHVPLFAPMVWNAEIILLSLMVPFEPKVVFPYMELFALCPAWRP